MLVELKLSFTSFFNGHKLRLWYGFPHLLQEFHKNRLNFVEKNLTMVVILIIILPIEQDRNFLLINYQEEYNALPYFRST